jgi:predicted hydrocarbon binding protein
MSNRIERILESININAGIDIYERVKELCGESDVKAILAELENACGVEVVAQVMKPCGQQCIPESFIARAKSIYTETDSIEDFLNLLNETHIGGGKLHIKGDKIIGIYEKCYCGLAKKVKDLSPLFCYCSEGWYERLFSSVLEKPVKAKKVRTILDGSDKCEFEISY